MHDTYEDRRAKIARMTKAEYTEHVREMIREGLESLRNEPAVSPEEAKRRAYEAIRRASKNS